jgi:hypothetical protein
VIEDGSWDSSIDFNKDISVNSTTFVVTVNVNAPRKLASSKSKSTDWLARNRDNVSEVAVDCQV